MGNGEWGMRNKNTVTHLSHSFFKLVYFSPVNKHKKSLFYDKLFNVLSIAKISVFLLPSALCLLPSSTVVMVFDDLRLLISKFAVRFRNFIWLMDY
ncbi:MULTISPECIES: hypothetical protein [unclassified Tolypothrix]|nr:MULTISPECIES: hypothetical protein [unclassified Tolypothrix]UYD34799.1 hypothetical protein HG267_02975 [Tolypothrix sp. PCC 7601]